MKPLIIPHWLPIFQPWTADFWATSPWWWKLYWAITLALLPFVTAAALGWENAVANYGGRGWLIGSGINFILVTLWWRLFGRRKMLRQIRFAPLCDLEDSMLTRPVSAVVVVTIEKSDDENEVVRLHSYGLSEIHLCAVLNEAQRRAKEE